MIKFAKDDYLIVKDDGKLHLGTAIAKGTLLLEQDVETDEPKTIKFKKSAVMANLGKEPIEGKSVYGIKINPFISKVDDAHFGQINFYTKLDEEDEKAFLKNLKMVWKLLSKNKCIASFPYQGINVMKASGKTAGSIKRKKPKGGNIETRANFTLQDYQDKEYVRHAMLNIFARTVWLDQVPDDIKLKWTKLYHKYLVLKSIDEKELVLTLQAINTFCQDTEGGDITSYTKVVADEDEKILINAIVKYITSVHKIKKAELDKLIIQDPDFVKDIWPVRIDLSLPKSSVSLAAEKSVEDMFAECFAFHLRGAEMSKTFTKYMKNTIKGLSKKFES